MGVHPASHREPLGSPLIAANEVALPLEVVVAVLVIVLPGLIALMAWIVREMGRTTTNNALLDQRLTGEMKRVDQQLADHDREIEKLWGRK